MQRITIAQYIQERLDDQYKYYSKAAGRAKKKYQTMKAVEIALAATIPFLSALISDNNAEVMKVIVGTIGVAVTFLGGMLLLYKHQEYWVTYRSTAEALKSEKFLFLTRSGPYRGKGANGRFIEKVETILGDEHQRWQNFVIEMGDEEDDELGGADGSGDTTSSVPPGDDANSHPN